MNTWEKKMKRRAEIRAMEPVRSEKFWTSLLYCRPAEGYRSVKGRRRLRSKHLHIFYPPTDHPEWKKEVDRY